MKIKAVFVTIAVAVGFWIAYPAYNHLIAAAVGAVFGVIALGAVLGVESQIGEFTPKTILGGAIGIGVASLAFFAFDKFLRVLAIPPGFIEYILVIAFLLFFYFGIMIGVRKGREADLSEKRASEGESGYEIPKILDTSVIIDGRIADVAEVGFINGVMILPKFIIKELQYIADSPDPIKRVRGRRGLDVLKRMQDIPNITVKISNDDFPNVREADLKLVELAKNLKGIIITNDFNLNKVAGIHKVKVLNLNQLANSLKPVVLPGEAMSIRVVKEGKEGNQGVGYLEDGTMVVVDDARRYLGRQIEVSVTSVLQTPTGRMIFSKVKDEDDMVSDWRR